MKRPMVIFDTSDNSFVKIVTNPAQAKELGEAFIKAAERADKVKENVWVGLTPKVKKELAREIPDAPKGPGFQEV